MDLPKSSKYSTYLDKMSDISSSIRRSVGANKINNKVSSRPIRTNKNEKLPDVSKLGAITTRYGGKTNYEKFHPGIDIANKIDTPIASMTGGRVSDIVSGKRQGDKGYGNYVIITDKDGNRHRYSHLTGSYVKVGDEVGRGTILGGMGNTGSTYSTSGGTGSHLDYRIRDLYGKYVNPYSFINQYYGNTR